MLPRPPDSGWVYQTVFHPGVVDPGQAVVISLRSGEERSGVGLQLKVAAAFQVSGRIALSDGNAGRTQVTLMASGADQAIDSQGFETATALTDESGRFHFFGVPEGEYLIKVMRVQPPPTPTTSTSFQAGGQVSTITSVSPAGGGSDVSSLPTLWASLPVTVNRTISDLNVSLAYGARVRGRLEFEGTTERPTGRGASVSLVAADGRSSTEIPIARSGPDYQFTTAQYRRDATSCRSVRPLAGGGLSRFVYEGMDVLRKPLTLGSGDVAGVIVTGTDLPAISTGPFETATTFRSAMRPSPCSPRTTRPGSPTA